MKSGLSEDKLKCMGRPDYRETCCVETYLGSVLYRNIRENDQLLPTKDIGYRDHIANVSNCVRLRACMRACVHACVRACVCVYVCQHVNMYVCMYAHTHTLSS